MLNAHALPLKIQSVIPPLVFIGPATNTKYAIIGGVWFECDDTVTTEMLHARWSRPTPQQNIAPKKGDLSVQVASSNGKDYYTVEYNNSRWICTCPSFGFRRKCKHIDQVKSKK